MKTALLDRRFGSHDPRKTADTWILRHGVDWDNPNQTGQGNTFALIDTFGEVMTGPLEISANYDIIKGYDLIYCRVRGAAAVEALRKLRMTCRDSIIILYSDEWVGFSNFTPNTWLTRASKYVDAVTCGFGPKYEAEAFRQMGINNYWHCPYGSAVNHWRKYGPQPREERENVVAGMWHIRSFMQQGRGDRQHSVTLRVLRALQERHGVDCWFFLNFDGWKLEKAIRNYADGIGLKVELLKHMPNNEFNKRMASAILFFEEYPCPAYSRATVVSAAVGTPQISTDMNEPSLGCFPDLTVDYGDWGRVLHLADKLITDEAFWKEQRDKGLTNVDYYWYPALRTRIMNLYNHLRKKNI